MSNGVIQAISNGGSLVGYSAMQSASNTNETRMLTINESISNPKVILSLKLLSKFKLLLVCVHWN